MEQNKAFVLNKKVGYFKRAGVDVMAFDDIYPSGHQSGVSVIMHGKRIATNGDVRFEQTPGQWQPIPKQNARTLDTSANTITTRLSYPDMEQHLKGFNPLIYTDYRFSYTIKVSGEESGVRVTVDLDEPIPAEYAGKLCFDLELFPGEMFDQPWILDGKQGIFPRQPNGPVMSQPSNLAHSGHLPTTDAHASFDLLTDGGKGYCPMVADDLIAEPYASGQRFTACPDDPYKKLTVESMGTPLHLYDGRMNHNNGWFVLSAELPQGVTKNAVEWVITPSVVENWVSPPVVQISQVGYHPAASKLAIIELDRNDTAAQEAIVYKITENGKQKVCALQTSRWGDFLRYNYLKADFSAVKEEGLYQIAYGTSVSSIFRIAADVYERGVWQPVLEYFLPVQMCHMRVNEKYRVWHDRCHMDDATMAPVGLNHFDGYRQGDSTLCKYKSGEHVPHLNEGGWHDAGDYDLRVESQAGESYILTLAYEAFNVDYDATTIDQSTKTVEIHQPDGKNDILQQIEHGALTVVNGYRELGRLYRGIIANSVRQYVLLGDAAAMTDGVPGNQDDRWVFTENNPPRELRTSAHLAAISRSMHDFNPELAAQAFKIAQELYATVSDEGDALVFKLQAATELMLTTGEQIYADFILSQEDYILHNLSTTGWIVARALPKLQNAAFTAKLREAMTGLRAEYGKLSAETPYGIPYRPYIWGAGWQIQKLGFEYYFLNKAFPDIFAPDMLFNALNFVLGCHPGSNTASFASGIGTKSATVAYGTNRVDWSYTPGGVISGTALIRPDFPELLDFPFLWQQTEYVLGGGSSNYMFLVLAARQLLGGKNA